MLLLHNRAFGEVSELNGFFSFVAISVFRQLVSRFCVLNVRTRCVSIHFILSKVSIVDLKFLSWTFGYVLSSFGFKVETDVGINETFAPFRLLGTRYLILAAWSDHHGSGQIVLLFFCGCF